MDVSVSDLHIWTLHFFSPFLLTKLLSLCPVAWGLRVNSHFKVLPQIRDSVLASPCSEAISVQLWLRVWGCCLVDINHPPQVAVLLQTAAEFSCRVSLHFFFVFEVSRPFKGSCRETWPQRYAATARLLMVCFSPMRVAVVSTLNMVF